MRFIEKMKQDLELRRQEKELKQEEKLTLGEMAQERIAQKRYQAKQKKFDEMLDMKFPCASIIKLKNVNGEIHYFQMSGKRIEGLSFIVDKITVSFPSKFKQLTGEDSGRVYDINIPSGYRSGMYSCDFNGFKVLAIDSSCFYSYPGLNCLQKQYGQTITMRQLLMRWKTDNNQFMNINSETDYEMVKRVYDSEDVFLKSKTEELSK